MINTNNPLSNTDVNDLFLKKQVYWKDLLHYKPWETIKELLLPLPWLILALWASTQASQTQVMYWLILAVFSSFYFFLTSLRVAHNAFHYCLGISRRATDGVMLLLSVLMLGSLHAIKYTHLLHHRHCLGDKDIEGSVAKQRFWEALIKGPLFPIKLHRTALRNAKPKLKQWITTELILNALWFSAVFFWFDIFALKVHVILMLIAYSLSAFFAVWTVHHDMKNDAGEHQHWGNSRTLRSTWKSAIFYNMFFHIEHHLFPQIPTCHLPELAKRLDIAGYETHSRVI